MTIKSQNLDFSNSIGLLRWIAVAHLLYLYACNQENYIHTISYDGFYFQVLHYKYYYWQKSNSDGSPKVINVYKQNTTKDITTFIAMLHNMSRPNHVTSICQPRTSTDADFQNLTYGRFNFSVGRNASVKSLCRFWFRLTLRRFLSDRNFHTFPIFVWPFCQTQTGRHLYSPHLPLGVAFDAIPPERSLTSDLCELI